jgi:hypothetical protein
VKSIEIPPGAQLGLLVAAAGAVVAAVAPQLPEIRRYLKVRAM